MLRDAILSVLFVVFSLGLFSTGYASDSLEYKLASINAGGYVSENDITVARFRSLLGQLSSTYIESQQQIADMSVTAQQLLKKDGIDESLLKVSIPPAKPGALRLLAPQRGLIAIDEIQNPTPLGVRHTPGTVKLCESPGRAGGLPGLIMEGMNQLFARRIENQKYAEYAAAYVTLRSKGQSHSEAIRGLQGILRGMGVN